MDMQQSSREATSNGINALGMALDGISNIRKDVDATGAKLTSGYGGVDGKGFQDLLAQWQEQAGIIAKNLGEMQVELMNTMKEHGQAQTMATDLVGGASQRTKTVLDALSG
ncbi:hypothetical protein ACIF9R_35805 [Streptomyces sp. NPDC086080]|uniref:hypothetical protein n=1 Tax=Streptomyces sp. NPDC086080 TaxID=3365748 RepID=UPI0037D63904